VTVSRDSDGSWNEYKKQRSKTRYILPRKEPLRIEREVETVMSHVFLNWFVAWVLVLTGLLMGAGLSRPRGPDDV
jgi:hypothetical protein